MANKMILKNKEKKAVKTKIATSEITGGSA